MNETDTTDSGFGEGGGALVDANELTPEPQEPETEQTAEASAEDTQPDPQVDESEAEKADTAAKHEWLRNKGIDPSDPEALDKVEQKWREAEKGFHTQRQEAKSKLRDEAVTAVTGDDEVRSALAQVQVRLAVNDFYADHPDARALDEQMAAIVQAKPYLASDLEAVYALASYGSQQEKLKAAEERGREAAKQEIARSSQAASPKGNASTSSGTTTEPSAFDKEWERYDS